MPTEEAAKHWNRASAVTGRGGAGSETTGLAGVLPVDDDAHYTKRTEIAEPDGDHESEGLFFVPSFDLLVDETPSN